MGWWKQFDTGRSTALGKRIVLDDTHETPHQAHTEKPAMMAAKSLGLTWVIDKKIKLPRRILLRLAFNTASVAEKIELDMSTNHLKWLFHAVVTLKYCML